MKFNRQLVIDTSKTEVLEDYWELHKTVDSKKMGANSDSTIDSTLGSVRFQTLGVQSAKKQGHTRNRSASDGTALLSHSLSAHHPAWSLIPLLDTFGPLIFPIYRAALLRKRILISGHAPVQEACNFGISIPHHLSSSANNIVVYNISVLSNTPLAVANILPPAAPPQRLKPLFNIGVHDIPFLEDDLRASKAKPVSPVLEMPGYDIEEVGSGWCACTTDGILATKTALYDVLITLPPSYSVDSRTKVWPQVTLASGETVKASQRDLRRYKALRWGLSRPVELRRRSSNPGITQDEPLTPRPRTSSTYPPYESPTALDIPDTDTIIEPLSWTALAYTGFMWWASAGEKRLMQQEETEQDSSLLADFNTKNSLTPRSSGPRLNRRPSQFQNAETEMAIIAYFHRLTTLILSTLSDIVDATDDDEDDDEITVPMLNVVGGSGNRGGMGADSKGPEVIVRGEDVERMGLDGWSGGDRDFVGEMVDMYFGRKGAVEGRGVDVCGVRIC